MRFRRILGIITGILLVCFGLFIALDNKIDNAVNYGFVLLFMGLLFIASDMFLD